jgi:hypothetical protein
MMNLLLHGGCHLHKRNKNVLYLQSTNLIGREQTSLVFISTMTSGKDPCKKRMANVIIAFKMIGKGVELPPRYQKSDCHVVFDIKIDNFQRKDGPCMTWRLRQLPFRIHTLLHHALKRLRRFVGLNLESTKDRL